MRAIRQDVVHAFRVFRRSPLFYAGLLLTLALGIGANGAVFGILRAVLLQPLPYQDADRVVMVWRSPERAPAATHDILRPAVRRSPPSGDQAERLHQQTTGVLSNLAVYRSWQGNLEAQFDLTLSDHAERLRGMLATANFFDVLGVTAAAGRVFTAADESSNEPVVVLSYALWQRAFGGDRSIIGRPLTLIVGRPRRPAVFTVIGVLPRTFRFTYPDETEAWVIHPWSEMTGRHDGVLGGRASGARGHARRRANPRRGDSHLARPALQHARASRDLHAAADHRVGRRRDAPVDAIARRRRVAPAPDHLRDRRQRALRPDDTATAGTGRARLGRRGSLAARASAHDRGGRALAGWRRVRCDHRGAHGAGATDPRAAHGPASR